MEWFIIIKVFAAYIIFTDLKGINSDRGLFMSTPEKMASKTGQKSYNLISRIVGIKIIFWNNRL